MMMMILVALSWLPLHVSIEIKNVKLLIEKISTMWNEKKKPYPGFELRPLCPFPTKVTIVPWGLLFLGNILIYIYIFSFAASDLRADSSYIQSIEYLSFFLAALVFEIKRLSINVHWMLYFPYTVDNKTSLTKKVLEYLNIFVTFVESSLSWREKKNPYLILGKGYT